LAQSSPVFLGKESQDISFSTNNLITEVVHPAMSEVVQKAFGKLREA